MNWRGLPEVEVEHVIAERLREAERERLAQEARAASTDTGRALAGLFRRAGATAAFSIGQGVGRIAPALDPAVASRRDPPSVDCADC